MPKRINTYRFGRALVEKFNLKGRYQPVLDETIVPVVLVDESTVRRLANGGSILGVSGAGNQNNYQFENPAGSRVLVVVQQWWAVSSAPLTDFMDVELFHTLAGAGTAHVWRDSRIAGAPAARTTQSTPGAAVLGPPSYHLVNDDNVWEQEWVLEPGSRLRFRQNVQNASLSIGIDWYEQDIVQVA